MGAGPLFRSWEHSPLQQQQQQQAPQAAAIHAAAGLWADGAAVPPATGHGARAQPFRAPLRASSHTPLRSQCRRAISPSSLTNPAAAVPQPQQQLHSFPPPGMIVARCGACIVNTHPFQGHGPSLNVYRHWSQCYLAVPAALLPGSCAWQVRKRAERLRSACAVCAQAWRATARARKSMDVFSGLVPGLKSSLPAIPSAPPAANSPPLGCL